MSCYVGGSTGFDALTLIKPDGRICFQSGIGNLGTESVIDVHRVTAEMLGVPWEKCDVCWGTNSKNVAWSCVSGGSQTTHAMTRAAHAVAEEAKKRLQEIAAKSLGGSPEQYDVGNEKVFRKGGGASMTLAQAAQKAIQMGGIYDGHEVNPDVNRYTDRRPLHWLARAWSFQRVTNIRTMDRPFLTSPASPKWRSTSRPVNITCSIFWHSPTSAAYCIRRR